MVQICARGRSPVAEPVPAADVSETRNDLAHVPPARGCQDPLALFAKSGSTHGLHDAACAEMGVTTGTVLLTCPGREALQFREGEPLQAVLALARQEFGPGKFTDRKGFVV